MVNPWVVLDVESIGLHGEGYAAGWVVLDAAGVEVEARREACPTEAAAGYESGRRWVAANCPPLSPTRLTPMEVRAEFWQAWAKWKAAGAKLVVDCGWPVEARFLIACVEDARPVGKGRLLSEGGRDFGGPYPLHELASLLLAAGIDPFATKGTRLPNELPEHDPLADARQSARLLLAALQRLKGGIIDV